MRGTINELVPRPASLYVVDKWNNNVPIGATTADETIPGIRIYGFLVMLPNCTFGVIKPWAIFAPGRFTLNDITVYETY